ncbi:MAG: hypothetical protein GY909_11455 [Oligoflexia bacterium]|nr:hypothetical protein [Oligoflexia bacterium]
MRKLLATSMALISASAFSLPIDWHGTLGFDTTSISKFRRITSTVDNSNSGNAGNRGTQEVPLGNGSKANASWQSYVFRLEPNLLVNDSATIKAELTSGYARGGTLGDSSTQSQEAGFGNALYGYNTTSGDDLQINKLFMELYSDTATYVIGRHSYHYGLGAIYHAGEDTWDRLPYIRDGVTLKVKLGNFNIQPYWARIGSGNTLTKATRIKEVGVSLVYDNVEKDMAFGIHYAKKKNAPFNSEMIADVDANLPTTTGSLGKTDVKITDIFFKKKFGDFSFGVEVPIFSGDIGSVTSTETKYNAKAVLFESDFKAGDNWSFGVDAGKVDGEDGTAASFKAMYLNPNYQIANLLFRYNLRAISTTPGTRNVYDSYITNALYAKAHLNYQTEKWSWTGAFIWARAEETATAGTTSFNHTTNKTFVATQNQADDLGMELDLDFNYQWNKEIKIGGSFGYLFTGDYFGFTNTATPNAVENSYMMALKTSIDF